MKRALNRFPILATAAFLLSSTLYATETRVEAMGGDPYLADITNTTYCPSLISKYRNSALIELGTYGSAGQWGGGIAGLPSGLTAACFVGRSVPALGEVYAPNRLPVPVNPVEIMVAGQLNSLVLGLSLYRASMSVTEASEYDRTFPDTAFVSLDSNCNASLLGVRIGASLGFKDLLDLDAWAGMSSNGFSSRSEEAISGDTVFTSVSTRELSGSYTMEFGARAGTWLLMDSFYKGAYVSMSTTPYRLTVNTPADTSELDVSLFRFTFGLFGAFHYAKACTASAGLGLDYATSEVVPQVPMDTVRVAEFRLIKTRNLFLPVVRFGAEHALGDHFLIRAGIRKYIGSTKITESYENYFREREYSASGNSDLATLGIGVKAGGFSIDANVSEAFFFELNTRLFLKMSLAYSFGGSRAIQPPALEPP